ncbi:LacI family DNA-binding transcriptional regulator [Nocardioides sp. NPDC051685]|uniref:LacI family DNA-binding transcriptional regulator n=1 Tax=Nocardioides sp. NPDC051685 TaxID=3364334 RepID=UPI003790CEB0
MAGERAATLSDVAREAGVSLATASRALNGSDRVVRPELQERVLAAANKLGYTPNANAQAMARGSTETVGLLVKDISDPYFSTIAGGLADEAEKHGLLVMLCNTGGQPEREKKFLAALRRQRSRAIVLAGSDTADVRHTGEVAGLLTSYLDGGGRAAAISQPRLPVDTVVIDNHGGAKALAERLVELGYRRAAVLTGPEDLLVSAERHAGFAEGWLETTGTEPAYVADEFSRDGGHRAMSRLLENDQEVDCVFAVNDLMALGALAACRQAGVEVGHGLAVAGFDDIATLRDVTPGLTTVRLPLADIGRRALELVLSEPSAELRKQSVHGEVVLRESTPPRT